MRFLLLLITAILLSGCSAPPSILPELQYVAPTGQGSLAKLVGSNEEMGPFIYDRTAYVYAVDEKQVMSIRDGWSKELPIQAGLRNVTVAFQNDGLDVRVDLPLQAVPGGKYQVRFRYFSHILFPLFGIGSGTQCCDLWIVDVATQKPVTEIGRGKSIPGEYEGGFGSML